MKVFVIEDNPVYNDYVCNLLKKDSFDTMSAYNLATAKKLLAKSEVDDIVVADLRLPDGESIELLRWMRANDKQQVFIVMTNYGEVHTAVESMKLGSKDYIQKQLLEDKLIPLIRTLIDSSTFDNCAITVFCFNSASYRLYAPFTPDKESHLCAL